MLGFFLSSFFIFIFMILKETLSQRFIFLPLNAPKLSVLLFIKSNNFEDSQFFEIRVEGFETKDALAKIAVEAITTKKSNNESKCVLLMAED